MEHKLGIWKEEEVVVIPSPGGNVKNAEAFVKKLNEDKREREKRKREEDREHTRKMAKEANEREKQRELD